ncbi:MAG: GntR family transcriptional regulator [Gemmatimonadaceae bacterium]
MTLTGRATAASERRAARPEQVYQKLRDLIVRGQLAPGSRVVETDVAARLGVSRTPVRAALQRLQQEGFIVDSPSLQQSRPTVAPLTKEDARELFHIVAEIEGLAARWAAALPPAARESLAEELVAINDQFRRTLDAKHPNHNRLWELDEKFHRRYVEAGAGPRLLGLHNAVKPQAERYERLYVSLLTREISTSVAEHGAIVRAIRSGNVDAAQYAVETNWRNAAERLGLVIDSVGERGKW